MGLPPGCTVATDLHTTFTRRGPPAAHADLASSCDPVPAPVVRRVLVVEDDGAINEAVTLRLRAEGYVVDQVWDGPAAVAACADTAPDAVVLDVMLPGYDGHEVCRRIQAHRPVPVLMLTARDDEADVLAGLAAAPTTT